MAAFITSGDNLTIVIKGKAYCVNKNSANFAHIKEALRNQDDDKIIELLDVKTAIEKTANAVMGDMVVIRNGVLYHNEKPVHNTLANRIFEFSGTKLPVQPLMNFFLRKLANPSFRASEELFDFLEHKNLPITEDGYFLAYKAIKSNWTDKHTGTIDNSVGRVVSMNRSQVDDDRSQDCSYGLHAGSIEYVVDFANIGNGDIIVIVKIDPADVVSVPTDCNYQKLRTCRYEVVDVFKGELNRPLYQANASEYDYEEEDDWEDDDSYDLDEVVSHSKDEYGLKPDGTRFWNVRDRNGHFVRKV